MKYSVLVLILAVTAVAAFAQTESARISGRVTDLSGAVIVGAECKVTNIETNVSVVSTTNQDGIYVIADLHPAIYRLTVQKEKFRTVVQPRLLLYVQDAVNENFTLALGPASESVTVENFGLQTDSISVSTVVDDQFVQNMPLNGRSFQSLIALAPGVVFTSSTEGPGQFSVNGQRSDANYFTIDGVSANFGSAALSDLGQSLGGAIPGFTSGGGTNGLVSVDAMQEFRIQTSSYAPEFGRTPGAQISIVTKSGTNQFHGVAFDYLRNDFFDARNYFDVPPLTKPPLRQNDFGAVIGGPIIKNKTFFFFSYEGLRLLLPQTASQKAFYTASARAAVAPVYQPLINALPLPTGPPIDPSCDNITKPCMANLSAVWSNPSRLNATSIRIDHSVNSRITLFARYNHAPSYDGFRTWEQIEYDNVNTETLTGGATVTITPTKLNDFRANWSRTTGTTTNVLTDFDGGVPPPMSVLFPPGAPYSFGHSQGGAAGVGEGTLYDNVQRQLNFVEVFSWVVGAHQLKFGFDYRRLNPTSGESTDYVALTSGFQNLVEGTVATVLLLDKFPLSVNVNNYSLFAQDTWKATNRLTLTYGLRWEINPAPQSASSGLPLYAVQGIFDPKPLALVREAPWRTQFGNFAPRFGAAWQVTPKTVMRGGLGFFYDLGYGNVGDASTSYPYIRFEFNSPPSPVPFDLSNPLFQPIPFSMTVTANQGGLFSIDPNLQLPLTIQWNGAVERELGTNQRLTATYVGADARRLIREDTIAPQGFGNGPQYPAVWNGGNAHYEALQLQFQRRMSHGLQALVSYSFAKASDVGSNDGTGFVVPSVSQIVVPPLTPSDFDLRHSVAGAVSYVVPAPAWGRANTPETPGGQPVKIQIVETPEKKVVLNSPQIVGISETSERFWQRFNGLLNFGVIYSKGNQSTQYNFGSQVEYVRERWSAQASLNSTLSASSGAGASTRNLLDLNGSHLLPWNNYFYSGLGSFLQSSAQGITLQTTIGGGVGRYLKNTNQSKISVLGGLAWQGTGYQPSIVPVGNQNLAAAVISTDVSLFRFNKTNLSVTATLFPALSQRGRVRFNTNVTYYVKLISNLSWNVSFYGNWDNRPPASFSGSDYGSSSGLSWTFGLK